MEPMYSKEAQALAALFRYAVGDAFYEGSDDWEAVEKIRQALEDAYHAGALAGYEQG